MWTVYLLLCKDNSIYTGVTNDLDHRMGMHQSGKGSKYVRSRLPFRLIYKEELAGKIEAMKREAEIKALNRQQKLKLISSIDTNFTLS